MLENFEHPERFALWAEAFRCKHTGEPIDWRPLLDGYQAIVDWPGTYFWRELTVAHLEAKVILTVRDPERWYASIERTIFSMIAESGPESGLELPNEIIRDRTFDGRLGDLAHCQNVFLRHTRAVQKAFAPDRLLVFDVREGWQPLCAFLGVPVPEHEAFPHLNESASFKQEIHEKFR